MSEKGKLYLLMAVMLLWAVQPLEAKAIVRKHKSSKSIFSPSTKEFRGTRKVFKASFEDFNSERNEFLSSKGDFNVSSAEFKASADQLIDQAVVMVGRKRVSSNRGHFSSGKFRLSESMQSLSGFSSTSWDFQPSRNEFKIPKRKKNPGLNLK